MTFTDPLVQNAVDRYFRPTNAGRAARRQVLVAAGTVILALATLSAPDWLTILLFVWVAWRSFVFVMLVVLGPRMSDELTRRLDALPQTARAELSGSGR